MILQGNLAETQVLRLSPERRFCRLGNLSQQVGWKQSDVAVRLEGQRKVKSAAFHNKKKAAIEERKEALAKL